MGLKSYKQYKKEQELKESEYIASLENRLAAAEKKLADLESFVKNNFVTSKFTNEEKERIKKALDKQTKPEDFISMFTGNTEEFNPNA